MALPVNLVQAQETIDVGKTGWDVKRKYYDENAKPLFSRQVPLYAFYF